MTPIVIDTKKVHDIHALFSLFESELGRDFGHNLDGLSDGIRENPDIKITITDIDEFRRIFGAQATREYFGERYVEDVPTLGEILLEIFQENGLLVEGGL